MRVYGNVLEMIGATPMLRLQQFDTGPCQLFLKLELANPGGSIKDRIAVAMISEAERRGALAPGDTIVEATAGNTGLGLALVAGQKGYRLVLVIPDKMSLEKVSSLRAMGVEIIMTRSDVAQGHPEYYQDLGRVVAAERGAYFINQFSNPDNALAHATTTAPETLAQMENQLDAIVVGVGSSGTITGLSQYFAEHSPATEFVLADPEGSVLAEYVTTGRLTEKGSWLVEGIGEDFIPEIADFSRITRAYTIGDAEAFAVARELLQREGIMAGSSTGTLLAAALRYCRDQTQPKRVVTFACDTGNRYLSKLYNDYWMEDQGFSERETCGDITDLIGRPHGKHATITIGPTDILTTAHNRMRNSGISQLPVMDGEALVGVLTEEDIMSFAFGQPELLGEPVAAAMQTSFVRLDRTASMSNLVAFLKHAPFAAVTDEERFMGLITRADVLNSLRKQMN